MYNDLDKKFDIATKKALPYLVLAPPKFRTEVAELMEVLFHQLLQRSDSDFDIHYAQLNDLIDNRNSFESNLDNRVWRFANMFIPMESTICRMSEQITKLEKRVGKSERETKVLKKIIETSVITKEGISNNVQVKEGISNNVQVKEGISNNVQVKEGMSNNVQAEDTILKVSGKFFCGICKNELDYWHKRVNKKTGKVTYRFRCRKCDLHFNMDADRNVLPIKRTKKILERIERLKAEQQRTRPKPGTPSAPV